MRACRGFRSQVGENNFVHPLHHPVRNRLPHHHPGNAPDHRRHAFNVLHVHGRNHVDLRVQQIHHVFVALAVPAAFDVGMRQLVHQHDLRMQLPESRPRPSRRRLFPYKPAVFEAPRAIVRPVRRSPDGRGFPPLRSPHFRRGCSAGCPRLTCCRSCRRRERSREKA